MLLFIICAVILLFGFVVFRGAPYVPSLREFAEPAFTELYPLTDKDLLVDVGSGDGRILRMAAQKGARAIGYELNPALVIISWFASRGNALTQTRLADFWLVDLPVETTIVYAFSVSRDMNKMERKLQQTAIAAAHPVYLMTYGPSLHKKEPIKTLGAYKLYVFEPKI